MAITTQDIHRAADEIAGAGGAPTLAAVRRALGGGSYTTISEAMQEWKARRGATPIREPAPAAVADRLAEFSGELWAIALDMANSRLESERGALEQARQGMEKARREAADLADQVSAELEQAQAALAAQAAELAGARAEAGRLAGELAEARRRADSAQAALAESRRQCDQLADLLRTKQKARLGAADASEQAAPKPRAKKTKPQNLDIEDTP
jgi:chromosome segregation ATPase